MLLTKHIYLHFENCRRIVICIGFIQKEKKNVKKIPETYLIILFCLFFFQGMHEFVSFFTNPLVLINAILFHCISKIQKKK